MRLTEGVAEHSSRLQPSINLHARVAIYSLYVICLLHQGMKADARPVQGF